MEPSSSIVDHPDKDSANNDVSTAPIVIFVASITLRYSVEVGHYESLHTDPYEIKHTQLYYDGSW